MPDMSQVQPVAFNCEGGLVLNRSTFMMQAGEALELQNFEPDIEGGYRRITGFSKYVSAIVPATASDSEPILMVATFGDFVLAARGTSIYSATAGGSSWTSRDSGRTSASKYRFEQGIKNMQTLLVNKFDYVRSTYIPRTMHGQITTSLGVI